MQKLILIIIAIVLCDFAAHSVMADEPNMGGMPLVELSGDYSFESQSAIPALAYGETSCVVAPPVKIIESHDYELECYIRASNSRLINSVIISTNSRLVGFSRSVDKYIYALHQLLI